MSTVACLQIFTWNGKFVVVGEFENHTAIPRREFDTYADALREFAKMAQREETRYESGNSRGFNR